MARDTCSYEESDSPSGVTALVREVADYATRMENAFRYFNSSPEVIRLTAMLCIGCPLSLRQVEDILFERGIDICHETVRLWRNRFGPMFAAEIRRKRFASE